MAIVQISRHRHSPLKVKKLHLFSMGFRPFFLGAALHAIISILVWMGVYSDLISLPVSSLSPSQWHAREMVFGYTMAVIAGFLLTAVPNWTGISTATGKALAALFLTWVGARITSFFGDSFLPFSITLDLIFSTALVITLLNPILLSKQRRHLAIIIKLVTIAFGNLLLLAHIYNLFPSAFLIATQGGVLSIVGLILTIAGRVYPSFVRGGLSESIEISTPKWLVISNIFFFLVFLVNYLFLSVELITTTTCLILFFSHTYRLYLWHHPKIWSNSLLWSLYLALTSIALGFALIALAPFFGFSPIFGIHAFAYGGIGLATVGMMSRVILGHTGRDIRSPSQLVSISLIMISIGTLTRTILPIFYPEHYIVLIQSSQLLWILAFISFLSANFIPLVTARADGKPG